MHFIRILQKLLHGRTRYSNTQIQEQRVFKKMTDISANKENLTQPYENCQKNLNNSTENTVLFGNTTNSDNKDLQNCSQIQDSLDQRILSEFQKL